MATVKKLKRITSRKSASASYKNISINRANLQSSKTADQSLLQKLWNEININQSYLSLIIGLLIVLVVGVLAFNYFKKGEPEIGTAQQMASQTAPDIEATNLPGKYTVKEGDTLYTIAEKYYGDGFKFPVLAEANKLNDENSIVPGQVLEIPKIEDSKIIANISPAVAKSSITPTTVSEQALSVSDQGQGGAVNQTIWGESITGSTYTVVEGDWLSTIAGRAYGDIYAFDKIAKANNIPDPNLILPGTVLNIPR